MHRELGAFYCAALELVIEVDGGVHRTGDGVARDRLRDESLAKVGLRVVHVGAEQVECDLRSVVEGLRALVQELGRNHDRV